jgi:hypothetical protein
MVNERRGGIFAGTFLDKNAQIQLQAEIMGGAIPLSEDEARDCAEGTFNPRLFPLLWAFYERIRGDRLRNTASETRYGSTCLKTARTGRCAYTISRPVSRSYPWREWRRSLDPCSNITGMF